MKVFYFALLTFALINTSEAAVFTKSLKNGSVLQKCAGSDVTLPWIYSLETGDYFESAAWYFKGEMMALYSDDSLLTLPAFNGRIELFKNKKENVAQLKLKKIDAKSKGDYSIKVTGYTASNSFIDMTRMLTLDVADNLRTQDNQLHLSKSPSPVWDSANSRWSIQLNCGKFLSKETPPFDVQWTDPSGNKMGSTGYEDGTFYLLLASSTKGGKYTCRLEKGTPEACLKKSVEATITISADETKKVNEAKPPAKDKRICPDGFSVHNGDCYVFMDVSYNWFFAQMACSNVGARLVEIDSEEKNRFVTKLTKGKADYFWAGLADFAQEGQYKLVSQGKMAEEYLNWNDGEPDNFKNKEDCVILEKKHGNWADKDCSGNAFPFVCEMPKGKAQHLWFTD